MMLSYVLRLGQRVVQHNEAPIILTGFQALNKLLGTNVYESNSQLGTRSRPTARTALSPTKRPRNSSSVS